MFNKNDSFLCVFLKSFILGMSEAAGYASIGKIPKNKIDKSKSFKDVIISALLKYRIINKEDTKIGGIVIILTTLENFSLVISFITHKKYCKSSRTSMTTDCCSDVKDFNISI